MQHSRWLAGLLVLLGVMSGCAARQTPSAPTGTLEKIKATQTIALGYRESAVPLSF